MYQLSDCSLKFSKIQCLGDEPQGFETLKPINIVIGRNNSGKSTLLDLCEDISTIQLPGAQKSGPFTDGRKSPVKGGYLIHVGITRELLSSVKEHGVSLTQEQSILLNKFSAQQECLVIERRDDKSIPLGLKSLGGDLDPVLEKNRQKVLKLFEGFEDGTKLLPFYGKKFHRINAERRLIREKSELQTRVENDGRGATNVINQFLTNVDLGPELVGDTMRRSLNRICLGDASFRQIHTRFDHRLKGWEVYLNEEGKGYVPMSKTGQGLHTVLLVLVHTILLTENKKDLADHVFAFEELENNLHPSLLRRLLDYIHELARESGATFLLTTHSPIVIDFFRNSDLAQIVHVTHDGANAECRTLSSYLDHNEILDDLDVRASDILQANSIVWVEGPTDRIYLKKWIEIASNNTLKEGIHFQCLTYGGATLAHYSAVEPIDDHPDDAIKIFTLNRHACVVMDSDKDGPDDDLKERVITIKAGLDRVDPSLAWITEGNEVENYLPPEALRKAFDLEAVPVIGQFTSVFDDIQQVQKRTRNWSRNKVEFAERVVSHINEDNWDVLDLKAKVFDLCRNIRKWNGISEDEVARQPNQNQTKTKP